VTYDLRPCPDVATPGVHGKLTVEEALKALLRGTGLHYELLDDRSLFVPAPTPEELAQRAAGAPHGARLCGGRDGPPPPPNPNLIEVHEPTPQVTVTGSYISQRSEALTPSLASYTQQDIAAFGAQSLPEFFTHLPQNLSSNSVATFGIGDGHNGDRATSVNLLGLGEPGTLLLVNGHRLAPSAMGDFVDVSLIPLASVERVDVLTDDAAAIYGADAVAGVVNIILREKLDGSETVLDYASPDHSGANEARFAQTLGTGWKGGHAVASLTFSKDQPLLGVDRPYSNATGYDLTPALKDYQFFSHGTQSLSERVAVSADLLYSRRYVTDDTQYSFGNTQVGPYHQNGTIDQYTFAPSLDWKLGKGWEAIADLDFSEHRFAEVTTYSPQATPSDAAYTTQSEARVRTADLRANGPLASLTGGDLKLSVGIGGRWENYRSLGTATATFAPGSFDRSVAAAYTELHLPAIGSRNARAGLRALDLSLALRAENYSDAGFTLNPKVTVAWQPLDTVRIRGTYGTSFSTPRFSDTFRQYNSVVIEPFTGAACPSGCVVAEEFGANSAYRPERSTSFNLGLDWKPARVSGLEVQSDFYFVHYRDQISMPPDAQTLVAHPQAFSGLVVPDPSAAFMSSVFARAASYPQGVINLAGIANPTAVDYYIDQRIRNLSQTLATGVDFNIRYSIPSDYGTWTAGVSGAQVLRLDGRASPASTDMSVINTFAHPISKRYQGLLELHTAPVTASFRVNYAGGYWNTQLAPPVPIASWTTLDAALTMPLNRLFSAFGEDSDLQLSVRNLANRAPPYVTNSLVPIGYDPVNANAMGRVIGIRVLARFGDRP
jgi:iron complex outermembrane recepter protein